MSDLCPRLFCIVALAPFLAALVSAFMRREQKKNSAILAIAGISASLVFALCGLVYVLTHGPITVGFNWIVPGANAIRLSWVLDPLSTSMAAMVSFVGLLIFIYSYAYMHDDVNVTRFFTFLSLFAGGMLTLVISNSLLLLFMAWEIVGLASYLLIGFWYHKPEAVAAARKAFITTRVGDIFFLIGIVWLYSLTGTITFLEEGRGLLEGNRLQPIAAAGLIFGLPALGWCCLLIFGGAAGKSGQIPLHVWLPDAMEGPTPVSALIHAATMVAAGVFLIARLYPVFVLVPLVLHIVAWIGVLTALLGAFLAVAQNDIKRILAYSTISQLGLMMLGLATGGPAVGMFHLMAHAFFKALLFLGAGSVIHGMAGEQNIWKMGGLRKSMPVTCLCFVVGYLALSGFPFLFSGFWSKDEILAATFAFDRTLFVLAVVVSLLTAFYMTLSLIHI